MKFTKHWNTKQTAQNQPIPGSGQVPNSAGGFSWPLTPWQVLERFLILGTEGGTFYVGEQKLTEANAKNLASLIISNGVEVVDQVVAISESGRAAKNDPAIFALALAASLGDEATRRAALAALPKVARTGTHLFQFAAEANELRGWGRAMRKGIQTWYNGSSADEIAYQAMKYAQRVGWSHRDLLRLAHPQPATPEHRLVYKWIVDGELVGEHPRLEAFEKLKASTDAAEAAKLIAEFKLPREAVPTELLNSPEVWDALLEAMPMTATLRNLATMTRVGLLTATSEQSKQVMARLQNAEALKKARVHPMAVLLALSTYASGHGFRGGHAWTPIPRLVDALDSAFYLAFGAAPITEKRYLLGVDVSGSMGCGHVGGSPLTACEAATAMAMVTMATEPYAMPMAFAGEFKKLPLTPKMRLGDALKHTRDQNFGRTDCALPMLYALANQLPIDVFVVYTDNETWFGKVHPAQALEQYRQKMGIDAKLIVVGMTSTGFSIANPRDAGMLDVVGFDSSVPHAMAAFVA